MTTRHEFLARLHNLLEPGFYLEVGVQTGESLKLATCAAWGIDPEPRVAYELPHARVFPMTSDKFFSSDNALDSLPQMPGVIDLAFIDGMHQWEYALRDFLNISRFSDPLTVIVFDDVLPRNEVEASRDEVPGDWTGDVWRVPYVLSQLTTLTVVWVDTFPTGTAVCFGKLAETSSDRERIRQYLWEAATNPDSEAAARFWEPADIPPEIQFRIVACDAESALDTIMYK